MRIESYYAYIEPGDTIEIYDFRGVSVGLKRVVDDPGDIRVWPHEVTEVGSCRVEGPDGRSLVYGFDDPQKVRVGMWLSIDPVIRLPRSAS